MRKDLLWHPELNMAVASFIAAESLKWSAVVKAPNIKMD